MLTGTAVYGTVRTVVWEDGGGNPASYPMVEGLRAVRKPKVYNSFLCAQLSYVMRLI